MQIDLQRSSWQLCWWETPTDSADVCATSCWLITLSTEVIPAQSWRHNWTSCTAQSEGAVAIAPSLPRSWLVLGVMAATPIMRNETSSGFFNCQLIPVYIFTWPLEHWDMFQVWDGIINWIHHSDIYIRLWGEILWWDDPLNPPLRYLLLFVGNICVMEFYIYIYKQGMVKVPLIHHRVICLFGVIIAMLKIGLIPWTHHKDNHLSDLVSVTFYDARLNPPQGYLLGSVWTH